MKTEHADPQWDLFRSAVRGSQTFAEMRETLSKLIPEGGAFTRAMKFLNDRDAAALHPAERNEFKDALRRMQGSDPGANEYLRLLD